MTPEEIKELRRALDWTTAQLGAHVARSHRTVENWEQGRSAPDALVVRVLHTLAESLAKKTARAG